MTRKTLSCLVCCILLNGCLVADRSATSGSSTSGGEGGTGSEQEGAGGGGGNEPTTCDDQTACGNVQSGCVGCAMAGPCASAVAACQSNPECADFESCATNCEGNQPCIELCITSYAEGASLYIGTSSCIYCSECFASCGGANLGC